MAASKPFKHRALNLDQTQIRLFRLTPAERSGNLAGIIAIYDFEHCPEYKAVSYTWGPPYPTREISLEGQSSTIRENLWQFLDAARDYAKDWLWIDQVCIDQSTVDERNHQVSLMAKIYAKASEVLIWLGTEAHGSGKAMEAINSGVDSIHQYESQVQSLFRRPYWDRLWVLQEVLMAQNILVLCGNQSFTWKRLEAHFIPQKTDTRLWTRPIHIYNVALSLIEEKASFEGSNRRLSYMLETFAGLQCEDIRDKVYGLLSLVRSSGAIPVDYSKTSADVFFMAIQRIVRDESFMEMNSHFNIGQHLRDRMMLLDINDIKVFIFIKKELREIRKESVLGNNGVGHNREGRNNRDLLWAAWNGQKAVVKVLLEKGADLEAKDDTGQTPLSVASEKGHKDVVQLLLAAGQVDVDSKDKNGQTPLWMAARNGHEGIVQLLLERGQVNVEAEDSEYSRTPLWMAAYNGHEDVVQLLLERGQVNVEAKDSEYSRTPLWAAAYNGHEDVVQLLLERGQVNVEAKDSEHSRTPLWIAAYNGHESVVKLLLATGQVNVDSKDKNGMTPLLIAAANKRESVVRLLLEKGADVKVADFDRWTPLHVASENGHLEIIQLLLDRGADVKAAKKNGWTLLHAASAEGHLDVVQLLLDRGADVKAADSDGWTPLHIASKNGHLEIIQLLLDRGADVKAADSDGWTPLHIVERFFDDD
jgi:ankyrin repeat protein